MKDNSNLKRNRIDLYAVGEWVGRIAMFAVGFAAMLLIRSIFGF